MTSLVRLAHESANNVGARRVNRQVDALGFSPRRKCARRPLPFGNFACVPVFDISADGSNGLIPTLLVPLSPFHAESRVFTPSDLASDKFSKINVRLGVRRGHDCNKTGMREVQVDKALGATGRYSFVYLQQKCAVRLCGLRLVGEYRHRGSAEGEAITQLLAGAGLFNNLPAFIGLNPGGPKSFGDTLRLFHGGCRSRVRTPRQKKKQYYRPAHDDLPAPRDKVRRFHRSCKLAEVN